MTKDISKELRVQQLRLLTALDVLAEGIASIARSLPIAQTADFIDRELSQFAVGMRTLECRLAMLGASLGFAIDVRLRAKIAERLADAKA